MFGGLDRITYDNILDYTPQIVRFVTKCVARTRCELEANVWRVDWMCSVPGKYPQGDMIDVGIR